jgi:L-aminopeptidase/D-esterase-like protein
MGYHAAASASSREVAEGNVGAGTGASVGKMFGLKSAMKSGLGTASMEIGNGVIVGAVVAVNSFGDVVDPKTGEIVAGARSTEIGPLHFGSKGYFANTLELMKTFAGRTILSFATKTNTIIGVVATNAHLTKPEANKMAAMAHDGLARAIRPAHTMLDGDTLFALATGEKKLDVTTVGAFAAEVVTKACLRAVWAAGNAGGLPGLKDSQQ